MSIYEKQENEIEAGTTGAFGLLGAAARAARTTLTCDLHIKMRR